MAIYNNGFPVTYPQVYMPQYQQAPAPQNSNSSIIWVQGEAGAKSYLVAPNNTVALFDSENQTIYLKSADASGMPSMKVLDYTIRESAANALHSAPQAQGNQNTTYATKGEMEAVSARIDALRADLDKLTKKEGNDNG